MGLLASSLDRITLLFVTVVGIMDRNEQIIGMDEIVADLSEILRARRKAKSLQPVPRGTG